MLRVAVIGSGQIARRGHLPGYARAGASVGALCSRPGAELDALADDFGVDRRIYDWRSIWTPAASRRSAFASPPALHCEMAVSACGAGWRAVRKAMALTVEECDRMNPPQPKAGRC